MFKDISMVLGLRCNCVAINFKQKKERHTLEKYHLNGIDWNIDNLRKTLMNFIKKKSEKEESFGWYASKLHCFSPIHHVHHLHSWLTMSMISPHLVTMHGCKTHISGSWMIILATTAHVKDNCLGKSSRRG